MFHFNFQAFLKADSPQVNEAVVRISNDHDNVKSKEKLKLSAHYAGSNILSREDIPEIKVMRYKYLKKPLILLSLVHCDPVMRALAYRAVPCGSKQTVI